MLKYKSDIRTVAYLLSVATIVMYQFFYLPSWNPFIYIVALYLAISVAVIAHNQNHVSMWKSHILNRLTDYWITLFYGFPTFAWIPTHNKNHHKFNNKEGDYTITYRVTESNHLGSLLSYPPVSSYYQQTPIRDFLKKKWNKNKPTFFFCISQYVLLIVFYALFAWIDWQKTLIYIFIPHQVALTTVLIFNYLQHVHADENSRYNHSRNFVGKLNGLMLFNNGFHTAHHENANIHWSLLPEAHKKIESKIDPVLNEKGFWRFVIRSYVLGLFIKKYRTSSMRLTRMAKEKELRSKDSDQETSSSLGMHKRPNSVAISG